MKKVSASRVVSKRSIWPLKLLSQAIAVAGAGMQASTVLAHPCPANPVHGAKTTTCFVADGETATILAGGSINVSDGPAIQFVGPGAKTVVNSGTLTGTTAAIQDQIPGLSSGSIAITNNAGGAINGDTTGIYVNSQSTLSLTNNGTITASTSVSAYGVYKSGDQSGSITNSGTISGTAVEGSGPAVGVNTDRWQLGCHFTVCGAQQVAAGIYVSGSSIGTLSNTSAGTITANATAMGGEPTFSVAFAVGVVVGGDLNGVLNNSGTIDVTAKGASSEDDPTDPSGGEGFPGADGIAHGIHIVSALAETGALNNSGHIGVTASGRNGSATGIYVGMMEGGSITNTNTGTITATASGEGPGHGGAPVANATAVGILVGESMASGSSITNDGKIMVDAASGNAIGIYVPAMTGTSSITNSAGAAITATSNIAGFTSPAAAGIFVKTMGAAATITNNGTISGNTAVRGVPQFDGVGIGNAIVVRDGSADAQIVNNPGGVLNGNVLLDGVSLTNAGVLSIPVVGQNLIRTGSFVGGNYTQSQSGLLTIGAFSLTQYGTLEVAGTADFTANGRLAVNVAPNDKLVAGGVLDNVVSAGTLITPTTLSVTDNSAAWDFTAVDDGAGGIDLTIAGHTEPLLAAQSVQVANVNLDELSSVVMGRMVTRRLLVEPGSHDQNLWLRSYGTTGSQDDDGDIPGYDIDTYGVVIGYDDNISEHWNAGAAFAYSNADIKAKGPLNDKIDTDFYQGAVYAYWQGAGHDYLDVMAIYGTNSNDSTREISGVPSANGDYDGWYTRLSSAIGKGFPLSERVTLMPSASVSYTYLKEEGYNEHGAGGLNLNVDSNDASSLIFGLDGQIAFSMGQHALLTAHVGAGYDALADDTSITSSFVGGTPFTTEGNKPDEWLGRAGVGAEVVAGDRIEMHVNYEYEYRDTFTDNLLAATLRWNI